MEGISRAVISTTQEIVELASGSLSIALAVSYSSSEAINVSCDLFCLGAATLL